MNIGISVGASLETYRDSVPHSPSSSSKPKFCKCQACGDVVSLYVAFRLCEQGRGCPGFFFQFATEP